MILTMMMMMMTMMSLIDKLFGFGEILVPRMISTYLRLAAAAWLRERASICRVCGMYLWCTLSSTRSQLHKNHALFVCLFVCLFLLLFPHTQTLLLTPIPTVLLTVLSPFLLLMLEAGGSLSSPSPPPPPSSSPSSPSSSFQMKILGIFSHICNKQILGVSLVKFTLEMKKKKISQIFL